MTTVAGTTPRPALLGRGTALRRVTMQVLFIAAFLAIWSLAVSFKMTAV